MSRVRSPRTGSSVSPPNTRHIRIAKSSHTNTHTHTHVHFHFSGVLSQRCDGNGLIFFKFFPSSFFFFLKIPCVKIDIEHNVKSCGSFALFFISPAITQFSRCFVLFFVQLDWFIFERDTHVFFGGNFDLIFSASDLLQLCIVWQCSYCRTVC